MRGWHFLESHAGEDAAYFRAHEIGNKYTPTVEYDPTDPDGDCWIVQWDVWDGEDEPEAPNAVAWEIES